MIRTEASIDMFPLDKRDKNKGKDERIKDW